MPHPTERQHWESIAKRIKEGGMRYGGLCGYISALHVSEAMTYRMKSRLLTSRYTENQLCSSYRWDSWAHKPRLAFIRKLLKSGELD